MAIRNSIRILALALLAVLLGSCRNPFRPQLVYELDSGLHNSTPKELLESLQRAYQDKNIKLYKKLLTPDFRFELLAAEVSQIGTDVNGDGIRDSWWNYEQEIEYTENLFTNGSTDGVYPPPDQIQLRLQIPPENLWDIDPEVGHEDWIVIPCVFDLVLSYLSSNTTISASGVARFYLRQIGNGWYIAIWRDESNL
ncbi:MAG TPA: hypothetical protein PL124_10435 [Candidatus Cloacimonadota bacterium]|nr:hypothetical protein [Candidatus Cloacimonadota bacterium]HPS39819.1 hypothetical protein [Candidatus Cloacimonadota bacterium]